jgi:hypothetical protein
MLLANEPVVKYGLIAIMTQIRDHDADPARASPPGR